MDMRGDTTSDQDVTPLPPSKTPKENGENSSPMGIEPTPFDQTAVRFLAFHLSATGPSYELMKCMCGRPFSLIKLLTRLDEDSHTPNVNQDGFSKSSL